MFGKLWKYWPFDCVIVCRNQISKMLNGYKSSWLDGPRTRYYIVWSTNKRSPTCTTAVSPMNVAGIIKPLSGGMSPQALARPFTSRTCGRGQVPSEPVAANEPSRRGRRPRVQVQNNTEPSVLGESRYCFMLTIRAGM